jgi:hypothetical protein
MRRWGGLAATLLSAWPPPHGLDAGQAVKVVLPRTRQRMLLEHVKAKPFGCACRAALTRSPPRHATIPLAAKDRKRQGRLRRPCSCACRLKTASGGLSIYTGGDVGPERLQVLECTGASLQKYDREQWGSPLRHRVSAPPPMSRVM